MKNAQHKGRILLLHNLRHAITKQKLLFGFLSFLLAIIHMFRGQRSLIVPICNRNIHYQIISKKHSLQQNYRNVIKKQ
jgi:hypothetical protein